MTDAIDSDLGVRQVAVRSPQCDSLARLRVDRRERDWLVSLELDESRWQGEGANLFAALRELRVVLDGERIVVGVNGARPNAAVSGMLADMGEGRQVYLLMLPRTAARPETAPTLAPAPLGEVVTVNAQDDFKARWLS